MRQQYLPSLVLPASNCLIIPVTKLKLFLIDSDNAAPLIIDYQFYNRTVAIRVFGVVAV